MPGRSGTNKNKNKPYRDALRMEMALAEAGEECFAKKGSLRWIARRQLEKAGEDVAAAKEVADRVDGKVPTPLVGGDDDDEAVQVHHTIERIIVRPRNQETGSDG